MTALDPVEAVGPVPQGRRHGRGRQEIAPLAPLGAGCTKAHRRGQHDAVAPVAPVTSVVAVAHSGAQIAGAAAGFEAWWWWWRERR
jgi:hypothetical protein